MKNPVLASLYLSPQEILKQTQIMNMHPNQLAIGRYHGVGILLKPWIVSGILLRLLGPILTKDAQTNYLKDIGTNFDHFSVNFPHGRVDFV